MRRQPAFGPARHHDRHTLLDFRPRTVQGLCQQELQCQRGVTAREIVHAAIALGLADDGHDGRRIHVAGRDGGGQRRGVLRTGGRKTQNPCPADHLKQPFRHRCHDGPGVGEAR